MTSGFLVIMAGLTSLTAILADMLDRIRLNQEKLMFYEKLAQYEARKVQLRSGRG